MLPDIGWAELLMIAVIAIVVVGPKELPRMLRGLGKWMSKARAMAREFQSNFDDMMRESELDELRQQVEDLKANNPLMDIKRDLEKSISGPVEDIKKSLDDPFGGADPTKTEAAKPESSSIAKDENSATKPSDSDAQASELKP